jgi:hypothetical protein
LFGENYIKKYKNDNLKNDDFYNLNKLNKNKFSLKTEKNDFFITNKLKNNFENKINLVI